MEYASRTEKIIIEEQANRLIQANVIKSASSAPSIHPLGGVSHVPDTLANFNTKIADADIQFSMALLNKDKKFDKLTPKMEAQFVYLPEYVAYSGGLRFFFEIDSSDPATVANIRLYDVTNLAVIGEVLDLVAQPSLFINVPFSAPAITPALIEVQLSRTSGSGKPKMLGGTLIFKA